MSFQEEYLFQIRIMTSMVYGQNSQIHIIVRRPFAYLTQNLLKVFEGQDDIDVMVDRRFSQRRRTGTDFLPERRSKERRQMKENLIDVVISD